MSVPLEDNFGDVIGKAQRGLRISDSELAEKAGVTQEKARQLREGKFDDETIRAVASALDLNPDALVDLARERWKPKKIDKLDGLAQFSTDYDGMLVNAYLVWDPETRNAAAFDTGADCREMLRFVKAHKLHVQMILLTHAHPDHVADLPRLREETGAHVFAPQKESVPGAESIEEGKHFHLGKIDIEARSTWGHSPGGMTFVANGLARPVAIAGDSIFAGSMGGGNISYADAVRNNLDKILTLRDETIICPGHGPMTTIGEEKAHNPFFAGKV